MGSIPSLPTISLLWLVIFLVTEPIPSDGATNATTCTLSERVALIKFRESLTDPHDLLSSWTGEDCCGWRGIGCDDGTGRVVKVDLRYAHLFDGVGNEHRLGGELHPSLLELRELRHLDISFNDFGGARIPGFLGSVANLQYLNLSSAGFGGEVPRQLGNLSNLQTMDLNSHNSEHELKTGSLRWLSRLSSLRYLDMSMADLGSATDWFDSINMLSSLSVLRLPNCKIGTIPLSVSQTNLTSLRTLDISGNEFSSRLPEWVLNMSSSLEHLDLRFNRFRGAIPDAFGGMKSLEMLMLGVNDFSGPIPRTIRSLCHLRVLDISYNDVDDDIEVLEEVLNRCVGSGLERLILRGNRLRGRLGSWVGVLESIAALDLSQNSLSGPIPPSMGELSTLRELFLDHNGLNGSIPESIGRLAEIHALDVSYNSLTGRLSEAHFANHTKLKELSTASNQLVMNVSSDWVTPFQLKVISMRSCQLGPKFPPWLRTQKGYTNIDISGAGIVDSVPDWFWHLSEQVVMFVISNNRISGQLPVSLKFTSISVFVLRSNNFSGPLPLLPYNSEYVDFSNNSFTGDLLPIVSDTLPILSTLFLAGNRISGAIPDSICKFSEIDSIDLSDNQLTGTLPDCFQDTTKMWVLNLASNNLSGKIPGSIGSLVWLQALQLSRNRFDGEPPSSIRNCRNLVLLDLGDNVLSGGIPEWIGESLLSLRVLRMRGNRFSGGVPLNIFQLSSLQILDLAYNRLSGEIPPTIGNLSAMSVKRRLTTGILESIVTAVQASVDNYAPLGYIERLLVVMKGREQEYTKTLQFVRSIDLSINGFTGEIPPEITKLLGLQSLNLSANQLTGTIPEDIGELSILESLDLSINKLSGIIPKSLGDLVAISHLNLSYNNLSGRIPSGSQLQVLDHQYMYVGNPNLCGPPLDRKCDSERNYPAVVTDEKEDDKIEKLWFFVSMAVGFAVGFWSLCGSLMCSHIWRDYYFKSIDAMISKFSPAYGRRRALEQESWNSPSFWELSFS